MSPVHEVRRGPDGGGPQVDRLEVGAWTIPTEAPESDGTLRWESTTIIVVQLHAGGQVGMGYTYGHAAVAEVVHGKLRPRIEGADAFAVRRVWHDMRHAVRNLGRPGLASYAIAAVDVALWDLSARLLGIPLVDRLGLAREAAPIYGSGGFTSLSDPDLQAQLLGWVEQGIPAVKLKVGRDPQRDPERVALVREAVGPDVGVMVDGNGAYRRKQALWAAERFGDEGVVWFEEPVSSEDLEGLRLLCERAPAGMEIAAGEYGFEPVYFERMLAAGAVDVLQIDATRAQGYTGFLQSAALAEARSLDVSGHTAPQLHAHVCCALGHLRHIEYFHDHVRIEAELFEGALSPQDGCLRPDRSRPGHGLTFRPRAADRMAEGR